MPNSCDRLRLAAILADVNAMGFGSSSSAASLSVKPIFLNVDTFACGTVFGYEYLIGLMRPPNEIAPNKSSNLMVPNESLRGREDDFTLLLFLGGKRYVKVNYRAEHKGKFVLYSVNYPRILANSSSSNESQLGCAFIWVDFCVCCLIGGATVGNFIAK